MKIKNLFGELVEYPENRHRSQYQLIKRFNNYRLSNDNDVRCKNCVSHVAIEYHDKTYHKCLLIGVSNSEATDIRISHVCDKWRPNEDEKTD